MHLSVILSTFNSVDLLSKALAGYERQTYRDFELLVADDGSDEQTRECLEELGRRHSFPIRHVWHEDRGFRKCTILNRAIAAASGEYLVLSDGDCVPWATFLAVHAELARPGRFLSGGYFKMNQEARARITVGDILAGRVEDLLWLHGRGLRASWRLLRLKAGRTVGRGLDSLTPTRPSWNGHNASGWKRDLLQVNGFDERMGWGGEDRELGERLVHLGLQAHQIRHRAICLHLWHERGYVDQEVLKENRRIRLETARRRAAYTPYGIQQAAGSATAP
jgi:GT2 family glycosyltransferase